MIQFDALSLPLSIALIMGFAILCFSGALTVALCLRDAVLALQAKSKSSLPVRTADCDAAEIIY